MNFLFPLFLIAGLAIAIPIIIHLFNFRKFKVVPFSDTRLLQQIKITSQKSRKIQNWWLLLSRILFVAALVLAFAQPYWGSKKVAENSLQIVYVDNSMSMADNLGGQRQLLHNALDEAKALINAQNEHQQYIFLSNNNIYAIRPIGKSQILEQLQQLKISAKTVSLAQINKAVLNALEDNGAKDAQVYIFSDLQKSTFLQESLTKLTENINFIIKPQAHKQTANLYIDTAFFTTPVLDTRQENQLVVKLGKSNSTDNVQSQVQVWVNGQVRAAKNVQFNNDTLLTDTVALMVNTPGWHRIAITVKDAPIQFDDTFRITAKTNATLSVLNLSDGINSLYLQAAFSPINGFMARQNPLNTQSEKEWSNHNLIVLQNVQNLSDEMTTALKNGLQNGESFFIIPGNIQNLQQFNQQLGKIAPIQFGALDTNRTQIGSLQSEHPLLKDVIAAMPSNAQLPTVLKYYPIQAALSAAQQSVMTLKNGKPFLAQYTIGKGSLFIVASSLDEASGNFVISNLFMPILYKMCAVSGAQSIYALNANSNQAIFVPGKTSNRGIYKAIGAGLEAIPPQNAYGNGTNIYLGKVINEPGFYVLKSDVSNDSTLVAINNNILESKLEALDQKALSVLLKPATVDWQQGMTTTQNNQNGSVDLWKWLAGIAIVALIIETIFLLRKK